MLPNRQKKPGPAPAGMQSVNICYTGRSAKQSLRTAFSITKGDMNSVRVIRNLLGRKPPYYRVAALTFLLGVLLIAAGVFSSGQVEANRSSSSGATLFPELATTSPAGSTGTTADAQSEPASHRANDSIDSNRWRDQQVRQGDNLSLIFARAGLQARDLQLVLDAAKNAAALRNIYPGQTISFQLDSEGQLVALRHEVSPLESTLFTRSGEGFTGRQIVRTPDTRQAFRHAVLKSSLFEAGQQAELSARLLFDLATVFGGVIDFALDPRAGDTFSVLYEEKYLDGEKIGEGSIIAAEYVNSGKHYSAFNYVDANGNQGYFGEDGVSMRRAFLRAPLDFMRVSSNFNMRRMHPIAKVVRPHRGVDYSAPTGTPVYASGDGKVIVSGYSRANGNYIFIQHPNQIVTRYLHLHKRNKTVGQRVKQGQTIGSVGSTGLATGPHLHYEFLVRGVHRNPRTVLDNLPRVSSLAKNELSDFHRSISGLKTQLGTYAEAWEIAVASNNSER